MQNLVKQQNWRDDLGTYKNYWTKEIWVNNQL